MGSRAAPRLTRFQIFTRIVLPPAFQRIYSSLVGAVHPIVMLGSSVISLDLGRGTHLFGQFYSVTQFSQFEVYLLTALLI